MPDIAIIGAGASGLSAAFQLARTQARVQVFEKSRGFSGRAASRSRHGCRYDYGANYFKIDSERVSALVFDTLPSDDLCPVSGDIGTFDVSGDVLPGDPFQNAETKWTYRSGISTLGKLLVETGNLAVTRETRLVGIHRVGEQWRLEDDRGEIHGPFDAVLVTAPAPQTIDLLNTIETRGPIADLVANLEEAKFHRQFCVILNYDGDHALPGDHYALINRDRQHHLAWLSHENRKPDRVPDGQTLLIAQLSPDWSRQHFDDDLDTVTESAAAAVADLCSGSLPSPQWTDIQRWKFAHPHSAANQTAMESGSEFGLFFAGDAFVGKGRLPQAIETGLAAARQLEDHFSLG